MLSWKKLSAPRGSAVGNGGKNERGYLDVIAKQITLGQLSLRPENFGRVADAKAASIGKLDGAVATRVLERLKLIEDGGQRRIDLVAGASGWFDPGLTPV